MILIKAFSIATLLFLSAYSQVSFAKDELKPKYLGYCSHFGDGVSFSFSSCINSNFTRVGGVIRRALSYCFNPSQGVSFSFTSCINSNFRTIEALSNGALYLRYCSNFSRDRLDFSYTNCVNSNFSDISRVISL